VLYCEFLLVLDMDVTNNNSSSHYANAGGSAGANMGADQKEEFISADVKLSMWIPSELGAFSSAAISYCCWLFPCASGVLVPFS
jgi:hypothetical protein